ncbi:MAG: ORF6N domain-containing protein [Bacteroidota bacterium]|nr:ORF6N domain-containing protein [Bacteroidota bacterium]
MSENNIIVIPEEVIMSKIYLIGDQKVMLDNDLAELYGVETKQLKRAVRRNIKRFPEDFMFELSETEFSNLRSQFGTSSWGGIRYAPMAFTEQGVAMLSSVLSSERAITVNILIIRIFTKMRAILSTHNEILQKLEQLEKKDIEQDDKIMLIFEYLKQFEQIKQQELEQKNRIRIGYK